MGGQSQSLFFNASFSVLFFSMCRPQLTDSIFTHVTSTHFVCKYFMKIGGKGVFLVILGCRIKPPLFSQVWESLFPHVRASEATLSGVRGSMRLFTVSLSPERPKYNGETEPLQLRMEKENFKKKCTVWRLAPLLFAKKKFPIKICFLSIIWATTEISTKTFAFRGDTKPAILYLVTSPVSCSGWVGTGVARLGYLYGVGFAKLLYFLIRVYIYLFLDSLSRIHCRSF